METLEEKISQLGLRRIDTDPVAISEVHQMHLEIPAQYRKKLVYFLIYKGKYMYYSLEHIQNHTVREIREALRRISDTFWEDDRI